MIGRRRARQRGFTLIELMVAMVVSSLLVGMILAIFLRMSLAYRGQQQVAGLQQVLASARQLIATDAKQAGLAMPTGVKLASSNAIRYAPVAVINNNTGPDEIRFIYADTTIQAAVQENGAIGASKIVDDVSLFNLNDLAIITTPTGTDPNPEDPTGAPIVKYGACVVEIIGKDTSTETLTFSQVLPYGSAANDHCVAATKNLTMVYKLVAHSYRIDPTRPDDGVLQMSATGDLFALNDWMDMGYGFTDIQVATQFYEDGDLTDTPDPDTDPKRDWYSSEAQEGFTAPADDATVRPPPLQMMISLVVRSDKDVEGIATTFTPTLVVSGNVDNNMLGDHDAVDLTTTADPALLGSRIYRYVTFGVDFRNTGIGR